MIYEELGQKYCHYVQGRYEEGTLVVFDGYDHPTTKNMTHHRRSAGKVGATVSFEDGMKVTMKRDSFLANTQNKKWFITLLWGYLEDSGCRTLQADGDADVLIVKTSISTAAESPTVLVGDDTDLLALLCFYTRQDGCGFFFSPRTQVHLNTNQSMEHARSPNRAG